MSGYIFGLIAENINVVLIKDVFETCMGIKVLKTSLVLIIKPV